MTSSLVGLASHGINASYRKSPHGITITRSPLDIVIVTVALLGLIAAILYYQGSDQIRLILDGDFDGDRLYVVISGAFLLVLWVLFIRANLLRRPVAAISVFDRSISYSNPGYNKIRIEASSIEYICVSEHNVIGRQFYYAVTVRKRDGNAINIATNTNPDKMAALANEVATVLSVEVRDSR